MVELSGISNANSGRNLPVLASAARDDRHRSYRHQAGVASDFASHLIAARDRLDAQRERRRVVPEIAQLAYDRSGRLDERRMPMGYRLSVSV